MDRFPARERTGGDPPSRTATGRYGYDEVVVIPWPSGEDERRRAAASGTPRLLVVEGTHAPPEVWDAFEDWMREPADPVSSSRGASACGDGWRRGAGRARPGRPAAPGAQVGGALTHGAGAHAPAGRAPGRRGVAQGAGGRHRARGGRLDPHRDVRSFVRALRHRLVPLGLHVHNVRGAGFLLQADELPGT